MDSNTIEQMSVSYLNLAIAKCEHLNSVINSNDKTLSWDGYVEVYSQDGNKKSDFTGRCPIQVKGKTFNAKDFKKSSITYPVAVDDLKNYLKDGGVIYFVVVINQTDNNYQIYYSSLLPFDIQRIISRLRDEQKICNVRLEKFPQANESIEEIFQDFLFHRVHHIGKNFLGNVHLIHFDSGATYTIWSKSLSEILDGTPKYIYKNLPHNLFIPVEKIVPEKINIANAPVDVAIDGKVYFHGAEVSLMKKNILDGIVLNKGLSIKVNKKGDNATVKTTKKCTIPQYIKNVEFLIALSKGHTLSVGNFAVGTNPQMKDDVSLLERELKIYKNIERLFERLNVKKNLKVMEISDSMFKKIDFLFRAVIEEQTFEDENAEPAFGSFDIGSLKLFMLRAKNESGKIAYKNPFEDNNSKCEMSLCEDYDRFPSSLFVMLSEKDFLKYDNLNYAIIAESIISVEYSDLYGDAVTNFLLNLLSAYDKRKDAEMLNCAIEVASWLDKNADNAVSFINKMQSICRKRNLTESELASLIEIQNKKSDESEIAICCSILLGEKSRYEYELKNLSKKRRQEFLKYPIGNLMK